MPSLTTHESRIATEWRRAATATNLLELSSLRAAVAEAAFDGARSIKGLVFSPVNTELVRFAMSNADRVVADAWRSLARNGLSERQYQSLRWYRQGLEQSLFTNMAEEQRRTGLAAQEPRGAQARIDRLVDRMHRRLLAQRIAVIGRTEARRAWFGGQTAFLNSFVLSGEIEESDIKRFWNYVPDGKAREHHTRIPQLNPDGRSPSEPFETEYGPLLYPADPNGLAVNTVNCRCTLTVEVRR